MTADTGGVRDVEAEGHGAPHSVSSGIKEQLEHKVQSPLCLSLDCEQTSNYQTPQQPELN